MPALARLEIRAEGMNVRVLVDGTQLGLLEQVSFGTSMMVQLYDMKLRFARLPEGASEELREGRERHIRLARTLPANVGVWDGDIPVMKSAIVSFYEGFSTDDKGRDLGFMLRQDDVWFEETHDFIQWMFPTEERSAYNPAAPVLTPETVREFRSRKSLRQSLRESLERFRSFLRLEDETPPWVQSSDHNHLRITRVLKCLSIVDMKQDAAVVHADILRACDRNQGVVPATTRKFWYDALKEKD